MIVPKSTECYRDVNLILYARRSDVGITASGTDVKPDGQNERRGVEVEPVVTDPADDVTALAAVVTDPADAADDVPAAVVTDPADDVTDPADDVTAAAADVTAAAVGVAAVGACEVPPLGEPFSGYGTE